MRFVTLFISLGYLPNGSTYCEPASDHRLIFFKDTSLVVIIGLFGFLTTIKVSLTEPAWSSFGIELTRLQPSAVRGLGTLRIEIGGLDLGSGHVMPKEMHSSK